MALYCSGYRERVMVSSARPALSWPEGRFNERSESGDREGISQPAEYPDPAGHFWTRGAIWRTEWIEPGLRSTRVRGDADPDTSTFARESDGSRVPSTSLGAAISWLYFAPTVVLPLLRHRGAGIHWYSQDTGSLGATSDSVHFGVNPLGLITVLAKDIGALAQWEQRIWSAHNVTPEGGVSRELYAAQMEVSPASTIAPERRLPLALAELDDAFASKHGQPLLRDHDAVPSLLRRAQRFQAAETDGILQLARELTRLFTERVNVDAILAIVPLVKGESKPGSLKAVERLIGHHRSPGEAKKVMAPLFGIYDLRLADAHLSSGNVESGLARASVDPKAAPAVQGRQLIGSFVDTLASITSALS